MRRIAMLMAIIPLPLLGQSLSDGGAEFWAHQKELTIQAAKSATEAGQDGNEVYRRGMEKNCATARLRLTGEARAKADAECAALEKVPRPVVLECHVAPGYPCPTYTDGGNRDHDGSKDHDKDR